MKKFISSPFIIFLLVGLCTFFGFLQNVAAQETKGITSDFTISGKVRYDAGSGFKNFTGAVIDFPGIGTAAAGVTGNFSLKVPAGYSGTITPIVCDESSGCASTLPPSCRARFPFCACIAPENIECTPPGAFFDEDPAGLMLSSGRAAGNTTTRSMRQDETSRKSKACKRRLQR